MLTLNNYNLAVKEIYLQLNLHTDVIVICCINDFYFIFTVDVSLIYKFIRIIMPVFTVNKSSISFHMKLNKMMVVS